MSSDAGDEQALAWREEEGFRRPPVQEERPLELLVLGGAVAGGTLLAVLVMVYKAWYAREMDTDLATFISGFLFFIYTGGVYIFCYAWERRDVARAVRLTAIVVLLSAVAVLIVAVALAFLSKTKGRAGGAGDGGDGDSAGINLGVPLRVLGSYVEDGEIDLEAASRQAEPKAKSDLFTITCWDCGQAFIPMPPKAACPNCGWTAVTVA